MPIYQAFQLAYARSQSQFRGQHVRHGSDDIIGGHLLDLLKWERTTLGFDNPAQLRAGLAADALQFTFRDSSLVG